jgi:hypothetical protein
LSIYIQHVRTKYERFELVLGRAAFSKPFRFENYERVERLLAVRDQCLDIRWSWLCLRVVVAHVLEIRDDGSIRNSRPSSHYIGARHCRVWCDFIYYPRPRPRFSESRLIFGRAVLSEGLHYLLDSLPVKILLFAPLAVYSH